MTGKAKAGKRKWTTSELVRKQDADGQWSAACLACKERIFTWLRLVEPIAFGITQMARGMPWGEWNDQVVMLHPLRWWLAAHQPEGSREMRPGRYRLFFVGGDLTRRWTEPFVVE